MRSGGRKDLPFPLRRERRPPPGHRAVPGERLYDRLLERPEPKPRSDGSADVGSTHARVVVTGEPERQLRPGPYAGIEHALLVRPDDLRIGPGGEPRPFEQLVEAQRLGRAGGVERAAGPLEGQPYEPVPEVSRVHELHRRGRVAGPEDGASDRDPPGPIGETVGRVVRPDVQPRTYAGASV